MSTAIGLRWLAALAAMFLAAQGPGETRSIHRPAA